MADLDLSEYKNLSTFIERGSPLSIELRDILKSYSCDDSFNAEAYVDSPEFKRLQETIFHHLRITCRFNKYHVPDHSYGFDYRSLPVLDYLIFIKAISWDEYLAFRIAIWAHDLHHEGRTIIQSNAEEYTNYSNEEFSAYRSVYILMHFHLPLTIILLVLEFIIGSAFGQNFIEDKNLRRSYGPKTWLGRVFNFLDMSGLNYNVQYPDDPIMSFFIDSLGILAETEVEERPKTFYDWLGSSTETKTVIFFLETVFYKAVFKPLSVEMIPGTEHTVLPQKIIDLTEKNVAIIRSEINAAIRIDSIRHKFKEYVSMNV